MADRVTVIGWDGSPLSPAALSALSAATLVAGAGHHLTRPEVPPAAERIRLGSVDLAARRIAGHRGTAVVLADGDPGFFGVVRTLRAPEHGLEVEVVPAVSSVAAAFARAGMPWEDARIVVAHQRTLRRAVNVCRAHPKVAVLTSPGAGPAELALLLDGVHRTFVVCEELGTDRERVSVLTSDKAADHTWRDPNVVLVIGGGGGTPATPWLAGLDPSVRPVRGWGLPTEEYDSEGPATGTDQVRPKAGDDPALRAAQLARLGPRTGDLVWDIGCAGGAFSVEAARFGAAVIAVDLDPAACARTEAAARRHGVPLQTVRGRAPHVLESLPEPDVVRIATGGVPVVTACADRRPERIVAHASTRDEAEAIGAALTAAGGYAVETLLLQTVGLDPDTWSERDRSAVFLLSGRRIERAP
ncbi:precorrin-6y C5,15-methyltransferase (decarboxylating) subunit CbiE [Streptomyces cinereoruber]|uniref:Precorrin-6y C5,15-methyltransferase (Decarboxylating) subunit CbiE n=1 Tax=Streptomyces cinereoruber TaxID=67260 RepID=A0AAV4KLL4_9ACTN|nr:MULTISPECIES: precorrin-6y C5,15-methyltransferase (decarboxylating) subunit CbiE [Streptomyces]AVH98370.1 precorrin-6y C5,15-methyltransferase (decarboxylating) subunit CbiE [Streptomyces sp. WAC00288]KYG52715.1 methyltransferase [Streptomyces sp. WAC04657]MBB4159398.1 precorrin-6Y C5,15-methyltransferase (decarboxylating) [Streptomyces cinereoruber]MBY8817447.1 precorrin-6y C5,15-methyltransferase (decarboxylating) subunit CbiE [Streptomyces cinereoruber]NIH64142.1 precorrin-6Y C5,15-meth